MFIGMSTARRRHRLFIRGQRRFAMDPISEIDPNALPTADMTEAGTVERALTLLGPHIAWTIATGHKPIENRHFRIRPGVYALHVGAGASRHDVYKMCKKNVKDLPGLVEIKGMKKCIVGAFEVAYAITLEEAMKHQRSQPWSSGPFCNVITRSVLFDKKDFIKDVKGKLSTWTMDNYTRDRFNTTFALYQTPFYDSPAEDTKCLIPQLEQPGVGVGIGVGAVKRKRSDAEL